MSQLMVDRTAGCCRDYIRSSGVNNTTASTPGNASADLLGSASALTTASRLREAAQLGVDHGQSSDEGIRMMRAPYS